MQRLFAVLAIVALAGCSAPVSESDPATTVFRCGQEPVENTLFFNDNFTLGFQLADASKVAGNGFTGAFTTNDMDEWRNELDQFPNAYWLVGNVTIEFWVQNTGQPAPIILGGDPGEGYHFFNQFGSDAGFIESYAIEYDDVASNDVAHFTEVLTMPEGGILIENGDRMRLLLTSLVTDGGHEILYGGDTPSNIRVSAICAEPQSWRPIDSMDADVDLVSNRGLLTGLIPAQEDVNFQDVPFTLLPETRRVTIRIEETNSLNEVKNDIDLSVRNATGEVWSIGSPYTDEIGTRWWTNNMAAGDYTVRVNSYSGNDYHGKLFITQDA